MFRLKTKKLFLTYLIIVAALILYIIVASPNLNILYREGAFFWCVTVTIFVIVSQSKNALKSLLFQIKSVTGNFSGKTPEAQSIGDEQKSEKAKKWIIVTLITVWGIYLAVLVGSSVLFNWKAYRDQMPEPEVKEFTSDVQAVDLNQIPIVDKALAIKLADKKLGEKPSLGSQVILGEPTIQQVNDKLVWVVPLHHSGFFKWLTNMEGTPGYIIVSATNAQDITYVDNYKIKYHPNSYFFDDLLRKVRLSSALFTGIVDYSFELDDEGKPYWVVTTYENLRGFSLPEASGIILLDAQTGEISKYDLDNIPEWVDRVQPEEYIISQINNKGSYVHGIFNFANKDKFRTSSGYIIVYNNEKCYLFTGITSVGVDSSATGFYMVDMVTKQPILYRISGATEEAAMSSAQGKVQDLGYKSSSPIILNVSDQPTYFMTLKDKEGLIKKYAYVSIKDYGIVGVGDTVSQAEESFQKALSDAIGSNNTPIPDENKKKIEAKVIRVGFNIQDGNTVYSVLLDGYSDKVFNVPFDLNRQLAVTQAGDIVEIEYVDDTNSRVLSFKNKTISEISNSPVSSQ